MDARSYPEHPHTADGEISVDSHDVEAISGRPVFDSHSGRSRCALIFVACAPSLDATIETASAADAQVTGP